MGELQTFHIGIFRRLTGWLALCLLLTTHAQPLAITTALWFANNHGHDHQIAVQTDGDHFDLRLSHQHEPTTPDDNHESLGWVATLFSTHDHDGPDHVLHFNLGEVPDQIRQRNPISSAPVPGSANIIPTNSLIAAAPASASAAAALAPEAPPPLPAGLIGLRTTVLLI